ncbi:MAG: hypothetical protein CHACPFDD_02265 [Phycisphaerae bacterium]|nr:hypothetical protein [Phycisphaerae bacterium]
MTSDAHPGVTAELAQKRRQLAPNVFRAFREFSAQVFGPGVLPAKVKELVAVGVAHVTQCPYCIEAHARRARAEGASEEELMETIWIAAEMRAGAAFAHSWIALRTGQTDKGAGSGHGPNGEVDESRPD